MEFNSFSSSHKPGSMLHALKISNSYCKYLLKYLLPQMQIDIFIYLRKTAFVFLHLLIICMRQYNSTIKAKE